MGWTTRWTKQEDARLYALAGKVPVAVAAEQLGRSESAVHQRCAALQLRWYQGYRSVSEAARASGVSCKTAIRIMRLVLHEGVVEVGTKKHGIRYLLRREQYDHLVHVLSRGHNKAWAEWEDRELLRMRKKGLGFDVVAHKLRRSAVTCRWRYYQIRRG